MSFFQLFSDHVRLAIMVAEEVSLLSYSLNVVETMEANTFVSPMQYKSNTTATNNVSVAWFISSPHGPEGVIKHNSKDSSLLSFLLLIQILARFQANVVFHGRAVARDISMETLIENVLSSPPGCKDSKHKFIDQPGGSCLLYSSRKLPHTSVQHSQVQAQTIQTSQIVFLRNVACPFTTLEPICRTAWLCPAPLNHRMSTKRCEGNF